MTKLEYMDLLRQKLKRLPPEDYQKAIDYFEEYFADAGEGNEAQAIEDLGTPQSAAEQIIRDFAIKNSSSEEVKKDVKKGLSGVWIVILAIFASPIALPLILAAVVVLVAVVIMVICVLAAVGILGITLTITGPIALIGGTIMMVHSIPVAMVCLGISLFSFAIGVLIVYAAYLLLRKFLYWVVVSFGRKFERSAKKSEKK